MWLTPACEHASPGETRQGVLEKQGLEFHAVLGLVNSILEKPIRVEPALQ